MATVGNLKDMILNNIHKIFMVAAISYIFYRIILKIISDAQTSQQKDVEYNSRNFTVSKTKLKNTASKIYEALDGAAVFGLSDPQKEKNDILEVAMMYNDDEFAYMVEYFNKRLASKCLFCTEKDTLRSWIQSEYNLGADIRKRVLERLDFIEAGV